MVTCHDETQPQISTPSKIHLPNKPILPDSDEFIFRPKLPPISIPTHLPLHTYIFSRLPELSDRTFLISASTGKSYTFSETHLICRKTASGLSARGIRKGDVVMLLLQNCPEFAFSFIASSMIGAITTTANPFCTAAEIHKQFKISGAKLIITQSQFVSKLRSDHFPAIGGEKLTVVTVDDDTPENCLHFSELSGADDNLLPDVSIDPEDTVALPFSSGTTGLPKGVMLTHRGLVTSVAQQVDGENPTINLTSGDVMLCALPMFHIYGLISIFLCPLRAGAGILLMQKFELEVMLGLIERYGVTVTPMVPPVVMAVARNPAAEKYDLSSVRMVLCGGSPLGKEVEDAFRRRVPLAIIGQGYGMTEASVLAMCPSFARQPLPAKSGACGAVIRNAEMRVVDPVTGAALRRNHPGEICIRGPQLMKGYLNDPEATAATVDAEGWLHTGDIGYVDDDDEVFIVDRVKELIKYKGFQVPPAELEALLVSHPSIAEAAVVPLKDEIAGEVPVAFIVPSKGFDLTEDAVKEFIAKQVVFYKRLHRVYFIDAIPKSPAGKILRKELRTKLATYS